MMQPARLKSSLYLIPLLSLSMSAALLQGCGSSSSSSSEPSPGAGGNGAAGASGSAVQACGPVAQLITDFTYVAGEPKDHAVVGTRPSTFSGQALGYGSGLISDVSGNDGHVSGMVTGAAGFHVVFDDQCIADASAFQGISFEIWGSISDQAPNKTIAFWVATVDDSATLEWLANAPSANAGGASGSAGGAAGAGGAMASPSILPPLPGTCTPTSGNKIVHPGCRNPAYSFELTGTEASHQKLSIKWTDFSGGTPNADASPGKITYIGWRAPQPTGMGTANVTAFTADIHIDNIAFIPR